ncbi:MAG: glycosyltransferase [Candidatus Saccharimonadales bacterium]
MKVGIVVPHIFMQKAILPEVIFSPGTLAIDLVEGLPAQGIEPILFTPGPVDTTVTSQTTDLSYFEAELAARDDNYLELLKKHPLAFISLSRQVQSELIAQAFEMANNGELDAVHIYANEEDIALPFSRLCAKPVVFTHHDPFNFSANYRSIFPKYKDANWLSISMAQRKGMPKDTNWVGNIYHGIAEDLFTPNYQPNSDYVAYLGRVIEAKGVHLAIAAVKLYNQTAKRPLKLKIAGKHYSGAKDSYWQRLIAPQIDGSEIEYLGYLKTTAEKQNFLGNAASLIIPSVFEEPFGMVMIEALACATPVIGLKSGAISEVLANPKTGITVSNSPQVASDLAKALGTLSSLDRKQCRREFEKRFTLKRMCREHAEVYKQLQNN